MNSGLYARLYSRLRLRFLTTLAALFAISSVNLIWAQQTLGSLNGTVVDTSGAAVAEAKVTVFNSQTGLQRTAITQQTGFFQIFNLPIGTYDVKVSHEGFDTTDLPGINIQEATATTLPVTLNVGHVSTSVTVTANPLLNATDATTGYTLDKEQIALTPLATGSFTQLDLVVKEIERLIHLARLQPELDGEARPSGADLLERANVSVGIE